MRRTLYLLVARCAQKLGLGLSVDQSGDASIKRLVLTFIFLALIMAAVASQGWLVQKSTAQVGPTPGTATYNYDSLGQVVLDVYPANAGVDTFAYSYDAAGNRESETRN
jgi:hypothetical protein